MKKRLSYILFIFLLSCSSSKEFRTIQKEFNKPYVESENVGVGGQLSKLYTEFHSYYNELTENEKKDLALNGNLTSKFYASQDFFRSNKKDDLVYIFKHNLKDQRPIEYLDGCMLKETQINTELYRTVISLIEIKSDIDQYQKYQKSAAYLKDRLEYFKEDQNIPQNIMAAYRQKLQNLQNINGWKLKDLTNIKKQFAQIALESDSSSKELISLINNSTI